MLIWTSSVVEVTILPVIFCTQRMHAGHFCTFHQHLLHLHSNNFLVWSHAGRTIKELEKNNKQTKVMPVMVVLSTVSVNVGSNHQRHFPFVQKSGFPDGKQIGMDLYNGIFLENLEYLQRCSSVLIFIKSLENHSHHYFAFSHYSNTLWWNKQLFWREMKWNGPSHYFSLISKYKLCWKFVFKTKQKIFNGNKRINRHFA